MAISFTFQPYTGYTTPVVSVYSDQTALATSTNSSRQNYALTADVIIDGNDVGTLKCYPLNNIVEVNPQKIAENYLVHTFNYNLTGVTSNPESIKSLYTVVGETFSRALTFTSVTNDSNYALFNCTTTSLLSLGDRILIKKDDSSVNPQYNTYSPAHFVGSYGLLTDIPYSYSPLTETGTIYEGAEFYDFTYVGGVIGIQTTHPHHLNVGDTVYVQMDSVSTGKLKMVGGTTGSITGLYINGVNILSSAVPFTTDIPTTMNLLESVIQSSNSGYTAYQYIDGSFVGSDIVHIYSMFNQDQATNGYSISATSTGDINLVYSPNMYINSGVDAATGEGWNPQFTGTYTVTDVPSSNTLLVNGLPYGYNNEPGSQRGSIVCMNNYVFTGLTTGATYYIMNNSNPYDYNDYASTINGYTSGLASSKFMTNKPRTNNTLIYDYYSTNDIVTVDILNNPSTSMPFAYMFVETFSGNNISSGNYFMSLSSFTDSFSASTEWERLSIGVGAWNLNNYPSSAIIPSITPPPTGDMITDSTNNYTIRFYSAATLLDVFEGKTITETLTFKRKCSPHKISHLIWANKWGAMDFFPLVANYEETLNVDRTSFETKRGSIINQNTYGLTPIHRGVTDFAIKSSKTVKYYTDWLTLAQANWLAEVVESPQVYLYVPSVGSPNDITALYPVNVTLTALPLPNERSRMKSFEIDVQISNRRITQIN